MHFSKQTLKYLELLAEKHPTTQDVCREIINLTAILNLPKGTEHFMSDLHGEYDAFYHILNNCSGVIREKVDLLFSKTMSASARSELCTLIYYPKQKLKRLAKEGLLSRRWQEETLKQLIALAQFLSSKYTRSKVRKAIPPSYQYIIDELIHSQPDEDDNQIRYHQKIIQTLIQLESGNEFIITLSSLIKQLAVDCLHIVGDVFDRGAHPDRILDLLMQHHNVLFEWGNHDILWMGAAAGNWACIAAAVKNSLSYGNMQVLESGYGISLRPLALFAAKAYPQIKDPAQASLQAISLLSIKLDGQTILRHPEYGMNQDLLLFQMDETKQNLFWDGKAHPIYIKHLNTIEKEDPYALSEEEQRLMEELALSFHESIRLHQHIRFLYQRGAIYRCYNGNLLFHGCIPLKENGDFYAVSFHGKTYAGKAYLDYADAMARKAYFSRDADAVDFLWYLWCGTKSPLFGREYRGVLHYMLHDKTHFPEPKDPYYQQINRPEICDQILREFGLFADHSHIINGHTPIKAARGESPIKAGGKLIVIDGGFCKAYQKTTGIAGYTLISNSHGMRIKSHQPFHGIGAVLAHNEDILSDSDIFETAPRRILVAHSDTGKRLQTQIHDLQRLLAAYRAGILSPEKAK